MAVGAGSIKRASKLNAEAENKKVVETEVAAESNTVQTAEVESAPAQEEVKTPAKKTTTAKTTTKKTTTRKAPTKKVAEKPVEEKVVEEKPAEVKNEVEASVITNIDPVVLDVVLGKKEKKNKACHLTEDMPIHLL